MARGTLEYGNSGHLPRGLLRTRSWGDDLSEHHRPWSNPVKRWGLVVVLLTGYGCSSEADELRGRLQALEEQRDALQAEVEQLEGELAPLRQAQQQAAEEAAEEAAEAEATEASWGRVTGRYRCRGGIITGLVVRHGHARFQMGGLEHLQGNQSYPARVRGDTLFITDRQRGTVGWRIRDGGATLVPNSPAYARRCTKR